MKENVEQRTASTRAQEGYGGVILTLGTLSLLCGCFPLGVLAWVAADQELRAIDVGVVASEARSAVIAGKLLGILATLFWGGTTLLWLASVVYDSA